MSLAQDRMLASPPPDPPAVGRWLLRGSERVVSSQLLEVETFRAVDRERLLGHLDDVETGALDAIHVATAEVLTAVAQGEPLEFWTHDERQATAALSRGLDVRGI